MQGHIPIVGVPRRPLTDVLVVMEHPRAPLRRLGSSRRGVLRQGQVAAVGVVDAALAAAALDRDGLRLAPALVPAAALPLLLDAGSEAEVGADHGEAREEVLAVVALRAGMRERSILLVQKAAVATAGFVGAAQHRLT